MGFMGSEGRHGFFLYVLGLNTGFECFLEKFCCPIWDYVVLIPGNLGKKEIMLWDEGRGWLKIGF